MSQASAEIPDHDTPPNTTSSPNPNRSSIDLSMELERQLEADPDVQTPLTKQQRLSLDPNVLVHIIMQLRESIDTLNHEKEDLVKQLTESHSRIAEFKDTISLLMERCSSLETDLDASRKKIRDDEEAIVLLRSKGKAFHPVCYMKFPNAGSWFSRGKQAGSYEITIGAQR